MIVPPPIKRNQPVQSAQCGIFESCLKLGLRGPRRVHLRLQVGGSIEEMFDILQEHPIVIMIIIFNIISVFF